MATKKVELVVSPPAIHWVGDGFRVHNFIPGVYRLDMHRMDPFILLDYNSKHHFPPSEKQRGVGVHPHKGFETVSVAYKGKVAHHDSTGAGGVIEEGDVQWMTAGSGILHKEYHEKDFSLKGGDFHMVQLWVNLPAKHKLTKPKYQNLTNDIMGKFFLPDEMGVIEVIAGNYYETKGPAYTFSPVNLMNARLKKGAKADFSFPENHNTALLIIEGEIGINGTEEAPTDNLVLFGNNGEDFTIQAKTDSIVLVLSGEPLNEPIAARGPFVMNTQHEIVAAYQEYYGGKFGYLED